MENKSKMAGWHGERGLNILQHNEYQIKTYKMVFLLLKVWNSMSAKLYDNPFGGSVEISICKPVMFSFYKYTLMTQNGLLLPTVVVFIQSTS